MATVVALTAERTLEIENKSVVKGYVDTDGVLILETYGGDTIVAGPVHGTDSIMIVRHGDDPLYARPPCALVHWIGVAKPAYALPSDFWTRVNLPQE